MADMALEGVKVLDLTHYVAGPFCTKLLADYGADVIKVERPPDGDPARSMGPFHQDDPHPEKSGLFLHLNTNKRSITVNFKSEEGKGIIKRLVDWADILVESFKPGTLESYGLGYDSLREINPRLVMTSISNFGQSGPYRDYKSEDMIAYAMGGAMHATGTPDREPSKLGLNVILYQAGAVACLATMVALTKAELQGEGDYIDLSIMDTQMGSQDRRAVALVSYQYTGEMPFRRTMPGSRPGVGTFPCADGYVILAAFANRYPAIFDMIERPDLLEDPRFSMEERSKEENVEALNYEYLMPWLLERTMTEIWAKAQEHHILSGLVFTIEDLVKEQHFRGRGFWEEIDHPYTGKVTYPGRPFIMPECPWDIRKPAPLLGQHNKEVLGDLLGYDQEALVRLRETGVT